jgi:hypothetical protein
MFWHITRIVNPDISNNSFSQEKKFHPWHLIFLSILLAAFMLTTCSCDFLETPPKYAPPFELEKKGRNFGSIKISPNGEDWIFTEYKFTGKNNDKSEAYILKLNIPTRKLYRYDLPAGYDYAFANFSPRGNWIVAIRYPSHDNTYAKFQKTLENGEIVMMRTDGSDFQVLSAPKGRYVGPAMSPSETKIAYWLGKTPRPEGSKTILMNFDVYEYDLTTKQSSMFSGPFEYFGVSDLQYIDEDTLLLNADYPLVASDDPFAYAKKYNNSEVYIINRGQNKLPDPAFSNIENASNASLGKNNNYYMYGQDPKKGASFVRVSAANEIEFWTMPIMQPRGIVADPNGRYMAFQYIVGELGSKKRAMGALVLDSGEWIQVRIPPFDSAISIPVKSVQ